jgi:hypothetical protein
MTHLQGFGQRQPSSAFVATFKVLDFCLAAFVKFQRILIPPCGGSNPPAPASNAVALSRWGWTRISPGDLFDIPGDGKPAVRVKNAQTELSCGLAWFLKGERVRGLGPEHAVLGDGTRAFDRVTRREWVSSYIGRDKCKNHCIAKTGGDVA